MADPRKLTFALDEATPTRLNQAAELFGRLNGRERLHLLWTFDEVVPPIPSRGAGEVDRELKAIAQARRSSGRRTPTQEQK